MPQAPSPGIEQRIAALAKRLETTSVLVEILYGQLHRELGALRELQAECRPPLAIVAPEANNLYEISPAMLTGTHGAR